MTDAAKVNWQKWAAIVAIGGTFYGVISHMEAQHDATLRSQVLLEERLTQLEHDVVTLQQHSIKK